MTDCITVGTLGLHRILNTLDSLDLKQMADGQ